MTSDRRSSNSLQRFVNHDGIAWLSRSATNAVPDIGCQHGTITNCAQCGYSSRGLSTEDFRRMTVLSLHVSRHCRLPCAFSKVSVTVVPVFTGDAFSTSNRCGHYPRAENISIAGLMLPRMSVIPLSRSMLINRADIAVSQRQ